MGDVGIFVITMIIALITLLSIILGWASYRTYEIKKKLDEDEMSVRSIVALKEAEKKLNAALRIHEHRLDHQRDDIYGIQRRLDILESGHPDSDIDYATLDDHDEVVEVWFNGKKYIPEDKLDEDSITVYADGRIVAETTRPDVKCCATCQHYRPESGYSTCDLRTWLHVTKEYANSTHSACNNYEATPAADEVEYIRFNHIYKDMGGNAKAKRLDELQCKIQELNVLAHLGGCTRQELRQRWEELLQNDS